MSSMKRYVKKQAKASNSRCPIIHRKQVVLSIVVFAIGRKMRRTDSTSYDSGLHRQ